MQFLIPTNSVNEFEIIELEKLCLKSSIVLGDDLFFMVGETEGDDFLDLLSEFEIFDYSMEVIPAN